MSIFNELFPDGATREVFVSSDQLRALCAIADEVRACRNLEQQRIDDLKRGREQTEELTNIVAGFAGVPRPGPALATATLMQFPAKSAESERIQYPFCEACNRYHHPDDWQCSKNSPPIQCKNCNHPQDAHSAAGHCRAEDPLGPHFRCCCESFEAAASASEANRIEHPWCKACNFAHHHKWPRCKKHGESGVTLEMITAQPNENLSDAEFPTPQTHLSETLQALTLQNRSYQNSAAKAQAEAFKLARQSATDAIEEAKS